MKPFVYVPSESIVSEAVKAALAVMRPIIAAGKRTATNVLINDADGRPAYALTRRGLIVSATQMPSGIWYSHDTLRAQEKFGLSHLKYSEFSDLSLILAKEIFGNQMLPP